MRQVDDGERDGGIVRVADGVADEFAVDLEFVERESPQISQTGIAGAEVVHRQLHAERFQLVQCFDGFFGIAHQQRLGQFQFE